MPPDVSTAGRQFVDLYTGSKCIYFKFYFLRTSINSLSEVSNRLDVPIGFNRHSCLREVFVFRFEAFA